MNSSIKNRLNKMQVLVLLILVFCFPLSSDGIVVPIYGIVACAVFFLCSLHTILANSVNPRRLILSLVLILYLGVGTLITLFKINSGFKFGYERCIYLVSIILIFCSHIKNKVRFSFFQKVLDIIMISIIIINILSYLNIGNINGLLINKYTQYQEYITSYQFQLKKPVLTFGVHNIAAFIYEGLFLLFWFTYDKTKERRYIWYSLFCIVLLIALQCTTSIGYVIFSISIIIYAQTKSAKKVIISFFCLVIIAVIAYYYGAIGSIYGILGKESNGFIARYFSGMESLYGSNIKVIEKYVLGIGYSIPGDSNRVYNADSGYIVSLTIGNFGYLIVFYLYLNKFLSDNIKGIEAKIVLLYIFLMELGFITFLYFRSIAFLLFMVLYLSALQQHDPANAGEENRGISHAQ